MIIMNRNTSPIKPLSDAQILKVVQKTNFNQYPDQEKQAFVDLYADYFDLNSDKLEVANGSDEWIQKLVITLGKNGVMTLNPDFVMYTVYTKQIYPEILKIDCQSDFSFDFDKILASVEEKKPSLFLISNPHNPTGAMFKTKELQRLADAMLSVDGYLALDECYIDFAVDYERPVGDNIIVLRTLSKVYGMAGLRIGIAMADKETLDIITGINHPYPLNSLSLNLASELFSDKKKLEEFKDYQFKSKDKLVNALDQVKDVINVKPSYSNYIFTFGKLARSLSDFLIEKDFLVRTYDEIILKDTARYSIIKLDEYPALNSAIKDWRKEYVD